MSMFTKIKSGAKLTISGVYEADAKKTDSITLANKTQLTGGDITFTLAYVDKVTGSKFDDSVRLVTAPLKTGTIDLGKGNDTLTIAGGDYKLTLKNTETVVGTNDNETLQLSGVAAFSTDGTIDSILGDKSGQTVTFAAINANSSIDLGKGKDTIILADTIGPYTLASVGDAITVTTAGGVLTIRNDAAGVNKSLNLVIGGTTYTWDQAIAYASDESADADNNFAVSVAAGDLVTNNAEKTHVQLTLAGVDSDAASVVVTLTDGHVTIETAATKQKNGTWTVSAQNLSSLRDGTIDITATVTDRKGNTADASSHLTLDTTADANADLAVALADGIYISQTAKNNSGLTPIAFEVSGLDDDLDSVTVSITDGTKTVIAFSQHGQWLADLSSLANTPLNVTVSVTDIAGNTASVSSGGITVVVDSFEGTITEFQSKPLGFFDDYVTVIVTDTAAAFNGSDLSGGNWSQVKEINVTDASNPVTFNAAELAQVQLTLATGRFTITGTGDEVAQLPASIFSSLGNDDSVVITGAVSVSKLMEIGEAWGGAQATVSFALADTAEALLELNSEAPGLLLRHATSVTVVGEASVAQIADLTVASDDNLSYSALTDTAAHLVPDGTLTPVVSGNLNIKVVDDEGAVAALNLVQHSLLDAANGTGTITFRLADAAAGLFGGGNTLQAGAAAAIAGAQDVTLTTELNLAQANAIKAVHGNVFTGVSFDLSDAAASLFSGAIAFAPGAADAIAAANQVTITTGLTFSQALLANGANNNSYEALWFMLSDTELNLFNGNGVASLRTDAQAMLENAASITVTGDGVTLEQAALIYAAHGDSFANVTLTISDTAAHIVAYANDGFFAIGDQITVQVAPTAISGLTVPQLEILMARIDNASDVEYSLSLSEAQVFTADNGTTLQNGYANAIAHATAVEITDALTPAQATVIFGLNTTATYDVVSNAADALDAGNAAGMNGARNVTITDAVSAVQATTIVEFENGGTTTYDVIDSAASAASADAAGLNGARDITITDAATAAQATTIANFTNGGSTTYDVTDTAANAANGANANGLNGAQDITITGNATVLQAAVIAAVNNTGTTSYQISDSKAAVFSSGTDYGSAEAIAGAASVTVAAAVDDYVNYLTVAQAQALKASLLASETLTAVSYSIRDTKEAIIAATDAGLFSSGGGITVGDVDVTDPALGVITTADLAILSTRIGPDQTLSYTYSFLKSDLFDPADSTAFKPGIQASIQSATAIIVGEPLSAAQAAVVHIANQDGVPATLTMDVADNAIALLANMAGVNAARNVEVTGTTAAILVTAVETLSNSGTTTYNQVSGSVAEVTGALGGQLALQATVVNLGITGAATAAQVVTLEGYQNTGDTTYAQVADSAANIKGLLNGQTALQEQITNLSVTGVTPLADVAIIEAYGNTGTQSYAAVTGTVAAVIAALEDEAVLQAKIIDLTLTGTADADDIAAIEAFGNTGDQSYAKLEDTAASIKALLQGNADLQADIVDIHVLSDSDFLTTADDFTVIEAYGNTNAPTYSGISDSATAITSLALDGAAQLRIGNFDVEGATTTAEVTTIEGYANTGTQYYEEVTGSAADVKSVVGNGGSDLQGRITQLSVSGTTSFADAEIINGYDVDVDTVSFARVDASYAQLSNTDKAAVFANAVEIRLTGYSLGEVTVAQIQALLANERLKDAGGGTIDIADFTFMLKDNVGNLTSSSGDTVAIMGRASAITVDNSGNANVNVNQAKTIYDRADIVGGTTVLYDIVDSPASLANASGVIDGATYTMVIGAGRDLTATSATSAASAAQAATIYDRDGAAGDVIYSILDSYANITAGVTAKMAYAQSITVFDGSYGSGDGADKLTALYSIAATGDLNGTAKLFMKSGESFTTLWDNVADWNTFVDAHPYVTGTLEYQWRVYDTAANITSAANDAGNTLHILTGSQHVYVSDSMTTSQAETFWDAIIDTPFGNNDAVATAAKTTYRISDSVANLTDAKVPVAGAGGDNAAVQHADYIYVVDTIEAVHAAQNGNSTIGAGDADVFRHMDELSGGGITASGSDGNQTVAGSKHGDTLRGGNGNDTLYGNAGDDTLYGDNGNDTLYGGDGRDTIYAGTGAGAGTGDGNTGITNRIYGGNQGDNMFGSGTSGVNDRDQFIYAGNSKAALKAESGTYTYDRDYISDFGLGDSIDFSSVSDANVQFFGSGSANAIAVAAGTLAISIRYEKNQQVMNWNDNALVTATKVMVDIADETGKFDDVADMHIIIVGSNIDLNWNGSALSFGG